MEKGLLLTRVARRKIIATEAAAGVNLARFEAL